MNKPACVAAAAILAASMAPGCIIWDDPEDDYVYVDHPVDTTVFTTIDADQLLETDLGYGAGVFVEYGAGGRWTVWTSCDSEVNHGQVCYWDVHVRSWAGYVADVYEYDTEDYDRVDSYGDGTIDFYAETDWDSDSIEFYTDPGASVEIELVLDGYLAPEYFVWYGEGYVHNGSNGTPLVFEPNLP
jgi:hypothetical protein